MRNRNIDTEEYNVNSYNLNQKECNNHSDDINEEESTTTTFRDINRQHPAQRQQLPMTTQRQSVDNKQF